MIHKFYVNNFRCFSNFELPGTENRTTLLIGSNGSGKSTVGSALRVLQSIARGTNRVGELLDESDFGLSGPKSPIRFMIDVLLDNKSYIYDIRFELPDGFKELRVAEERLTVDSQVIFERERAEVTLPKADYNATFLMDWHLVALPLIQVQSEEDPIHIWKNWLSRMIILAPVPMMITGESDSETLQSNLQCSNFSEWFSGLMSHSPSAYSNIDKFIKQVMPDFQDIKNPQVGKNSKSLTVQFKKDSSSLSLPFSDLSDGEKCFFICAMVIASNDAYGPIFCFWDEPDNYLALSEVSHFIIDLRRAFENSNGQLIATSHNAEAISRFSTENTLLLQRASHLEPTMCTKVSDKTKEYSPKKDLVNTLRSGEFNHEHQ